MNARTHRSVGIFLLGCVVLAGSVGGCSWWDWWTTADRAADWTDSEPVETELPAVPPEQAKLLADLNASPETHKLAFAELRDGGDDSSQAMVLEIGRWTSGTDSGYLAAARVLRVLREKRDPAAVVAAAEIARDLEMDNYHSEKASRVLLSETIAYLAANLDSAAAREAFLAFCTERHADYSGPGLQLLGFSNDDDGRAAKKLTRAEASGWDLDGDVKHPGQNRLWVEYRERGDISGLWIDVYPGLKQLVDADDPAVGAALAAMLAVEPYRYGLATETLDAQGFAPWKIMVSPVQDEAYRIDWLEPKGRARVLIMGWIAELEYHAGIPAVQALTRSEHADERNLALATVRQLSGAGN